MENITEQPAKDSMLNWGLFAIALSSAIFFFTEDIMRSDSSGGFGIFFINYMITGLYFLAVWIKAFRDNQGKLSKGKLDYTVLMMILWFISAFSLNRVMNVFDESVTWLSILIIISCLALIAGLFHQKLPVFLRHIVHFFLGVALMLFVYYAFYLVPLYVFSVPAAIAIGISLHTYVPLLLAIVTAALCIKSLKQNPKLIYSLSAGVAVTLITTIAFIVSWGQISRTITRAANQNILSEGKLPDWTVVSQAIPKSFVAERLIKAGFVYKTVDQNGNWLWGGFSGPSFDEPKKHDPLVIMASLFTQRVNLDQKERINILEAMYDSRHQAQERLWSGDKLQTANVISNVRIFPEYRMAYTEKILSIRNTNTTRWGSTQEAIYTFHLPEGAVVSSLSLWIEGKEEKAYLTTKSKADSAYTQIVGVENRDPSVIHWQEGNTVSVRVFPCNPEEDRKFKIGVSSPLRKVGQELIYENIYFDGPAGKRASETVQFTFSQRPEGLELPAGWTETSDGVYQVDRRYEPYWELSCKAPPLSVNSFSFDNKSYILKGYTDQYTNFAPSAVYLDLNSSWSEDEFSTLWPKISTLKVFAFEDKLVQLTEANKDAVFARLKNLNFSLFPVYKIDQPEQALLISKSTATSPNLTDLKDSEFAKRTASYLALDTNKNIRLYAIGDELSPYLKGLKELRVFNYHSGSISSLLTLIAERKFIQQQENDATVCVDSADFMILESDSQAKGNAPDHLLRLYAYNNIMKKVAVNYFQNDFVQADVLAEAEKANIVTPVSSLIVLETQKDYERFDIDESKNSLKNASMKSSGAVPEPHEWLMILLAGAIMIYLMRKPASTNASS